MLSLTSHPNRITSLILALGLSLAGINHSSIADESAGQTLQDVDVITIMPIAFPADQSSADRAEGFESLYGKLDDYIYKALLRKLAIKGYVLDKPRDWTAPSNWSVELLKSRTPQELREIAPPTASYVAFLLLEHLESSHRVVKSKATASVSAMILHRESGTILWNRTEEGRFSENFLTSPMWLTPDKHAAAEKAFGKLFKNFPEKRYQ